MITVGTLTKPYVTVIKMANGTKFTVKQTLLDKIVERVFTNKTFKVSAAKIQQNQCDMVESLWDRGGVEFVDTDYATLVNLYNTSTLVPGSIYRFPYAHKYVVDFNNVAGSGAGGEAYNTDITTIVEVDASYNALDTAYPAPIEYLYVVAMNINVFSPVAVSESFPEDIIYYSITDDTTEEVGAVAGNRSGFIHYREDPINRIDADFDFRNSITRLNTIAENGPDQVLVEYPVIADSGGVPPNSRSWRFKFDTTAVGSIDSFTVLESFYVRMLGPGANPAVPVGSSIYYTDIQIRGRLKGYQYESPTANAGRIPTVAIVAKHATNIKIGSDCDEILLGTQAVDSVEIENRCYNILFTAKDGAIPTAVSGSQWGTGTTANVKISNAVANIAILETTELTIKDNTSRVFGSGTTFSGTIGSGCLNLQLVAGAGELEIGDNCQDILQLNSSFKMGKFVSSCVLLNAGSLTQICSIDDNCMDISLINASNTHLGTGCEDCIVYGSANVIVGRSNSDVYIFSSNGIIVGNDNAILELFTNTDVTIGNSNTNLRLELSTSTIGNNNTDVYLIDPITDSTLGNNNTNVIGYNSGELHIGSDNDSIYIVNMTDAKIGDNNVDITLGNGSRATIGSNCQQVTGAPHSITVRPNVTVSGAQLMMQHPVILPVTLAGKEYFNGGKALGVQLTDILGAGNSGGNIFDMTVGNNCELVMVTSGQQVTIGDNAASISSGQDFSFSLPNDLVVSLDKKETVGTWGVSFVPLKAGAPTVGYREIAKFVPVPVPAIVHLGGIADLAITGSAGGADITVAAGLSVVKLIDACTLVTVNASDVTMGNNSDVTVNVPCTLPAAFHAGAVIELISPDLTAWFRTIDNAGVPTYVAYV